MAHQCACIVKQTKTSSQSWESSVISKHWFKASFCPYCLHPTTWNLWGTIYVFLLHLCVFSSFCSFIPMVCDLYINSYIRVPPESNLYKFVDLWIQNQFSLFLSLSCSFGSILWHVFQSVQFFVSSDGIDPFGNTLKTNGRNITFDTLEGTTFNLHLGDSGTNWDTSCCHYFSEKLLQLSSICQLWTIYVKKCCQYTEDYILSSLHFSTVYTRTCSPALAIAVFPVQNELCCLIFSALKNRTGVGLVGNKHSACFLHVG